MEREGYSTFSLLLAFVGGAVAGVAAAYLSVPENRERVRSYATGSKVRASRIPRAIKDASVAAKDAFASAYRGGADGVKSDLIEEATH
ncbi:MAG TPA: hypothetical protein VGQ83_17935 [Polyangia bacterium]|jgi:hypothetical protein